MTWLQMFMAYYVGYQLISFLRYCYRYGRQGAGPGSEGWMDYFETEGEDPNRNYLVYLVKTNKEKGHKPKPSLTTEQWAKAQAEKSSKAKKTTQPKKKQAKKKGKSTKDK